MRHHPGGQVGEAAAGLGLELQWLEILLLAPRTFQIHDQLAGYSQRNLTEVFLDQGERQVDSDRDARRRCKTFPAASMDSSWCPATPLPTHRSRGLSLSRRRVAVARRKNRGCWPMPVRARAAAALSGSTLRQRNAVCRERQDFNPLPDLPRASISPCHVVERYYGRAVDQATAGYMECHGVLWKNPELATVETEAAAGRDLYHRVGRLESPPPPARKKPALDGLALLRLAKLAEAGSQSDTRRSQQLRFKGYAVSSAPCPCRGRRWKRRARPWRAQPPGSRHSPPVRCCS